MQLDYKSKKKKVKLKNMKTIIEGKAKTKAGILGTIQ